MKGLELRDGLLSKGLFSQWRGSTAHRKLVEGVRAVLGKMGYCLKRAEQVHPVDLREHDADPRLLGYYRGNRPILVDVPMERGIGLDIRSLADGQTHPFVEAVQAAATSSHPRRVLREVLADYYRRVQPRSAAEWLGFEPGEIPALDEQPPWGRVLPWEPLDIETRRRRVEHLSPLESKNGGQQLTIADGWKTYGPVSDRLLDVEVERLYALLESIRRHGYRRHDGRIGDINVTVLWRSTDNWKWRITGGDHRAAVLSALDYRRIPVRVVGLVRPEEVSIWPNVDAGLYTRDQARALFDRLVDGEMPSATKDRDRRRTVGDDTRAGLGR